ncbi:MAG TPA: cupredoxin domain-containing protein [Acidimicrobiales bacterium]|nr:cupredoxin domain-containing protein [Acidimicrobiales bacterium]
MKKLFGFAAVLLAVMVSATACSDDKASGTAVLVTATDSTCTPAKTDFAAGKTTFEVKNEGDKVTELYVYGDEDKVVGEVENVGAGTSRRMTADLKAGEYELACKPGMTGSGIRTKIKVSGEGGSQGGAQATADREVRMQTVDYSYSGLTGLTGKANETIEFYLENKGTQKHEFELSGPDGKVLGEVEPVDPGKTDEAKITLAGPGTYTYVCGVEGHEAKGMKGTFTVS